MIYPRNLQNSERISWPHTEGTEGSWGKEKRNSIHYLFVMGNQLSLHMARHKIHSPQHLPSLQPPDGTSRINAGSTWKQPVQVSGWQE